MPESPLSRKALKRARSLFFTRANISLMMVYSGINRWSEVVSDASCTLGSSSVASASTASSSASTLATIMLARSKLLLVMVSG